MAPCADERTVIQQGGLSHLRQRLYHIVDVHMAQQDARAKRALQLLYAPIDVRRLQQVVPGNTSSLSKASTMLSV